MKLKTGKMTNPLTGTLKVILSRRSYLRTQLFDKVGLSFLIRVGFLRSCSNTMEISRFKNIFRVLRTVNFEHCISA